jgi:sugar phosphate isomerase/epimerase
MDRIISISTAAFDGFDLSVAMDEISRLGVRSVEVAFIQGYTDPFGEEAFSPDNAGRIQNLLSETGLSCFALSAHMNLGKRGSAETFRRRMEFACQIGAKVIVTNAGPRREEKAFMNNIAVLSGAAESLHLIIGLENPGDGKENIVNSGKDGARVVREINSEWVRLNYDFGNVISHFFERIRPEEDFIDALPFSAHLHIKDVKSNEQGWFFTEIGKGSIDYEFILKPLGTKNDSLPVSLEIPLRVKRAKDASPRRMPHPLPLDQIRNTLKNSLDYVQTWLRQAERKKG